MLRRRRISALASGNEERPECNGGGHEDADFTPKEKPVHLPNDVKNALVDDARDPDDRNDDHEYC